MQVLGMDDIQFDQLFVAMSKNQWDLLVKIGQLIGEGSFGIVYKAIKNATMQEVAVKKFRGRMNKYLVQGEIQTLKQFNHPNLVNIIACYNVEQTYYIMTEYCQGGNLADYLHKHQLNEQKKWILLLGGAKGLEALHEKNIMHRDIKPENLLVTNGNLKICDFGCAKAENIGVSQTRIIGTPLFWSPELVGKTGYYSKKCDIFSYALVIHYVFTGTAFFSLCQTESEIKKQMAKLCVNLDQNINNLPNCSVDLKIVLKLALKPSQTDRISAQDLVKLITSIIHRMSIKQLILKPSVESKISTMNESIKLEKTIQEENIAELFKHREKIQDLKNSLSKVKEVNQLLGKIKIRMKKLDLLATLLIDDTKKQVLTFLIGLYYLAFFTRVKLWCKNSSTQVKIKNYQCNEFSKQNIQNFQKISSSEITIWSKDFLNISKQLDQKLILIKDGMPERIPMMVRSINQSYMQRIEQFPLQQIKEDYVNFFIDHCKIRDHKNIAKQSHQYMRTFLNDLEL